MMQHKHIIGWIIGGVVVAVILIYFAVSNGVVAPLAVFNNQSSIINNSSSAPAGVSYNPADVNATSTVVTGVPEVPGQSTPISETQIPKSAVQISIARGAGFTPPSFTVKAGETVVVSITSADNRSHTFVFDDPSLSDVAVGVAPHETRVITFTAPAKPGNYVFRDNVFRAAERGTMVVK